MHGIQVNIHVLQNAMQHLIPDVQLLCILLYCNWNIPNEIGAPGCFHWKSYLIDMFCWYVLYFSFKFHNAIYKHTLTSPFIIPQVNENATELTITLIQEFQFGFYHCIVEDSQGVKHTIKKALNYKGPYFGDLWKKYENNVIISCSAAGGFLILAIILWVFYEKKYSNLIDEHLYTSKHHTSENKNSDLVVPAAEVVSYNKNEPEKGGTKDSNNSQGHDNHAYEMADMQPDDTYM